MLPYYPGCVWRRELLCLFVVVPCCHVDNQFAFHQPSREAKITKTSQTHIYFPSSVSEGGVHTGVPGLCRDPFLNAASPCLSHSICLQLKTRPSNHFFSLFFPPQKKLSGSGCALVSTAGLEDTLLTHQAQCWHWGPAAVPTGFPTGTSRQHLLEPKMLLYH